MLSLALVLGLSHHASAQVSQAEVRCPGKNTTPHDDGTYLFTYESSVERHVNRDHWDFIRCVIVEQPKEMYVDWKGTRVLGWASPIAYGAREAPSGAYELKGAKLVYGAGLKEIDTEFREVKEADARKQPSATPLRSVIRMAIPRDAASAVPQLVQIYVVVESRVNLQRDGRFRYTYSWQDLLAAPNKPQPFTMGWQSKAVQAALQANDYAFWVGALFFAREVGFLAPAPPEYAPVDLELFDINRKLVGRAPVSIYFPRGAGP